MNAMNKCPECAKPMRERQTRCSCGWRNKAITAHSQNYGRCEFNDHGLACGQAGSIALHVGDGGPWYCSKHALGIKGMGGKKSRISIKEYLSSVGKSLSGPPTEEETEARLEREAIQSEPTT